MVRRLVYSGEWISVARMQAERMATLGSHDYISQFSFCQITRGPSRRDWDLSAKQKCAGPYWLSERS